MWLTLWFQPCHECRAMGYKRCYRCYGRGRVMFSPSCFLCLDIIKWATSRLAHLERFSLNFSSSSFVIRVNLLHPQPSLFLYSLLLSLWCFSMNYYFQVSFSLKVILYLAKITQNIPWLSSFKDDDYDRGSFKLPQTATSPRRPLFSVPADGPDIQSYFNLSTTPT